MCGRGVRTRYLILTPLTLVGVTATRYRNPQSRLTPPARRSPSPAHWPNSGGDLAGPVHSEVSVARIGLLLHLGTIVWGGPVMEQVRNAGLLVLRIGVGGVLFAH